MAFAVSYLGDGACCGLFQVKELVDIIEAAESTIRTQVLPAMAFLDQGFVSFISFGLFHFVTLKRNWFSCSYKFVVYI